MNLDIRAVEADEDQRARITMFLSGFQNDPRSPDDWRVRLHHWWEGNPFWHPGIPRGWIIEDNERSVQGFIGLIPMRYVYGQKCSLSLSLTTWRVADHARSLGLSLFANCIALKKEYMIIDTTPSEVVVKMLVAFKFNRSGPIRHRLIPVRSGSLRPLKNLLSGLLSIAYRVFLPTSRALFVDSAEELDRYELASFLDSEKLCRAKDRDFLKWFCFHPYAKHKLAVALSSDGKTILAYAIVIAESSRRSFGYLQVIDYGFDAREPGALRRVLGFVAASANEFVTDKPPVLLAFSTFNDNNENSFGFPALSAYTQNPQFFFITTNPLIRDLPAKHYLAEGDAWC